MGNKQDINIEKPNIWMSIDIPKQMHKRLKVKYVVQRLKQLNKLEGGESCVLLSFTINKITSSKCNNKQYN